LDYKTSHYVLGEDEPDTQPQKTLSDIVFLVKNRLADALCDPTVGLAGNHPRVVISMVITNILVNLMFHSVAVTDVKKRLQMVKETLDEINEMTFQLWNALEAGRADTSTAH
jgi:hypothetical protein